MLSKHFGSRISYLRSVKGITQYELAQKAGLTSQYLGRIERGLVSPSFQMIENICSALQTHPANLFLSCNPELLYQQSTGMLDPGFHHCFGTTPTWIGVWTSHGLRSAQHWSSSVYAMLGHKPYSVAPTQRRFLQHVHPEHRQAVKDFLLSAAAGDSTNELPFLFFRKQGPLRIGLAHADQSFSDEGTDRFFQVTLLDVTEWRLLENSLIINRRELEEHVQRRNRELSSAIDRYQRELSRREELETRLRQSEQKYRQIVEVANEGIRVLDVHNRIVFINSKTERMFGYSAEELLGRDMMKFLHPLEKTAALQRDMERRQGRSERYACRQLRKNGTEFWTLTSATPIYDDLGEFAGSVAMLTDITELKAAQEELRRLHARLIEAQKAAGLGFWEWDGRTKALMLSDELCNILAIEPRHRPDSFNACRKFISPEDWPRFRKTVKDSWRRKKSYDLELRVLRTDQTHRHVIARGHPLIENDSLTGFFGTILDVTHVRHVEHDLEQKRQALNTFFTAALDMFCVIDDDDRFLLANPAWEDILGYAPQELIGRRYQEFMHSEDLHNVLDTTTRLTTQSNTSRFLHKNGTYHWLEWKAVRHEGHWYASARDTTEKQHMLEALERSETRFRLAMDVAKEGIWDWDVLSGNVYYSPGYFSMLGYTEMEFHGHVRTWKDLIHPEDSQRTLIANQQCIEGLVDSFQVVYRMRAKDGTWKWIMGTGRAVRRDDHGMALRMLGTHVDVTPLKQIQLDLVAAKTAAEAANRAKSVFLATMSHEIRTPLSGIMGTLEMLLEDNQDHPHLKSPLEMVLNASRSLLHILNDILDLAKIEAGKMRIIPRTVNLCSLIRSNMELFSFQAQKKNLKMSLDLRPHTPETVVVDPVRLGQVLRNLISNAVKFTRNGVVQVVVDTQKVEGRHIELHFAVEDSGVGLNPEFMCKIFQAFSQDNPIDQEETGSGLGLTICQMLVSSMGGRIDARNNPGNGCTFFFTIQAEVPSGLQRSVSANKSIAAPPAATDTTAPLHVLVAEDSEVNRTFLQGVLERAGHVVCAVENGMQALHALTDSQAGGKFDVVLMDLQMPVMSGMEATRRIREEEDDRRKAENERRISEGNAHPMADDGPTSWRIPIIGLTARILPEETPQFVAAGMNAVLTKPITRHELLRALQIHAADRQPRKRAVFGEGALQERCRPRANRSQLNLLSRLHQDKEEIINLSAAMFYFEKEIDIFWGAMNLFCQTELPELKNMLTLGISEPDRPDLRRMAHKLRGSAAALHAPGLVRLAEELETAIIAETPEQAVSTIRALLQELDRFETHARELLRQCEEFRPS